MSKKSPSPELEDPGKTQDPAPEFSPPPKKRKSLLDTLEANGGPSSAPRPDSPEVERPPERRKTLLSEPTAKPEPSAVEPRPEQAIEPATQPPRRAGWLVPALGWIVALAAVLYAGYLWQSAPVANAGLPPTPSPRPTATARPADAPLPDVDLPAVEFTHPPDGLAREPTLHTTIPNRPRSKVISYIVDSGDAIFSIAEQFNLKPETILWANYDLLNDNPDYLSLGMELNVPPVDGVYYQWQEGDTLESVAEEFEADVDEILDFSGNHLDLVNPEIDPGQWVMLPGGHREFRQWLIPTINRGNAGVNSTALGPGACTGSYSGAVGSGAFIWPSSNHTLSGNDFWSGHLAIDIGAVQGDPIFSSDAGVVVFSGWANGGYGNTVVVDHGNGYQTLYAHLSSATAYCGASVGAGTVIGLAGSTGNSTGTHLHFEVRLNGGFINPWFVLPPP